MNNKYKFICLIRKLQQKTVVIQSNLTERYLTVNTVLNYFSFTVFGKLLPVNFFYVQGEPITQVPQVSKQTVDLHRLYLAVMKRGGFEQVLTMCHL